LVTTFNEAWLLECFPPTDREPETTHLRKFLPKLKIMDKDMDLALYRDLSIRISRDRFDVKKHGALYLTFPKI
jgi:hypothetical protein